MEGIYSRKKQFNMSIAISRKEFGTYEGKDVMEYTLRNANGMQVSVINYGATITKIITIDKLNKFGNVIAGFDNLDDYIKHGNYYYGSIVGRYCNRIANGSFELGGEKYQLAKNNNGNSLHGGIKGFDKAWWDIEKQEVNNSLILTYFSKDGEEGFPGNLTTTVIYKLTNENELKIEYAAITDKATPVNLTNHCYFNLSAEKKMNILDNKLMIQADYYTGIGTDLIPTGEIIDLKDSYYDFTSAKIIEKDIQAAGGYDHNFILNKDENSFPSQPSLAASLYDPLSGRLMEMFTTEPAVQLYTAKTTDEKKNTEVYTAICLEAQHYPNSPNEPSFPNTILNSGETYRQTTIYKFSVKR